MSPASTSYFGVPVAMSGETAVIGTDGSTERVYVYLRTGDTWALQDTLESPTPQSGAGFGKAVAIDGDTIVVGAPQQNGSVLSDTGQAFVFTRAGTDWTYHSTLLASDAETGDRFGRAVAIDGDHIVVGAPWKAHSTLDNAGRAYVFTKSGGTWSQDDVLWDFLSVEADDQFGASVAIEDEWVVVGAPYEATATGTSVGTVFVFDDANQDGTWTAYQDMHQSPEREFAYYGISLDMESGSLIVGAMGTNGGVFVYTEAGNWLDPQVLDPGEATVGTWYGKDVAICGDLAIAGSYAQDVLGDTDRGIVFVFTRSGGVWTEREALVASDGEADDKFGMAVATNGTAALVGASWANSTAGAAYFYSTPVPPVLTPIFRFYNMKNGTHFYTDSAAERDHVIATWPTIYSFEGPAYYTNPANNTQPLTRLYNRVSGSHFYTASPTEAATALAKWPNVFSLDGPTYAVNPGPVQWSTPVYRFYNLKNGSHFYTASEDEKNTVIAKWPTIYSYEGPAFWIGQ